LAAQDRKQALRSTVVSMTFDQEQTAFIPIGSLAGVGYSEEKNDTFYSKADPATGTLKSHYVMPFQERAIVTLTNFGKQEVVVEKYELSVDPYQWNEESLYFHATWFEHRNITTSRRRDLNFVTVKGAGRYVGTSITVFNTCPKGNDETWWGEGDDKVYVDGETFPSIFGTGTEDYFGYAWCRPQRFYTPFISQPRGEGNKKWGYSNNNRHHLLDDIPFSKSVRFDMELWHPFNANMNYAAAAFFYVRPGFTHNRTFYPDSVRHKVALHRDDVLSSVSNVENSRVKIYVVAGQSNARGCNNHMECKKSDVFPKEYEDQPVVLFWDTNERGERRSDKWSHLGVPETGAFGPEIGLAHELMLQNSGQRIGIIKCAAGGTGIARSADYDDYIASHENFDDHENNWHPPSEHSKTGRLYHSLIRNVCDALFALDNDHVDWELAGFIWIQGEHEAGISRKMTEDYATLLARFIAALRADSSSPSLPFVIGEVNSHKWAYGDMARTMQAKVCQEDRHAVLVKTADLSREGSGGPGHFDADGMLTLGIRCAKTLISLAGEDTLEQFPADDVPEE
jgi:hypothetical protein